MIVQSGEHLEINGERMNKPIVEKPIQADDHNVRVYYGDKLGGGSRRLFRKIGDRSSRFYPRAWKVQQSQCEIATTASCA